MNAEVERAGELGRARRERVERRRVRRRRRAHPERRRGARTPAPGRFDRDPGRSSRSSRRPAAQAPSTASSSRSPCRPRRPAGDRPRGSPSIRPESRLRIGMPSGLGDAPPSRAGPRAAARRSPRSSRDRSRPGYQVLSLFDMLILRWLASRSSDEEPRAEVQPGREDRARGDRADVDVQQPGRRLHRARPRRLDRRPARR